MADETDKTLAALKRALIHSQRTGVEQMVLDVKDVVVLLRAAEESRAEIVRPSPDTKMTMAEAAETIKTFGESVAGYTRP